MYLSEPFKGSVRHGRCNVVKIDHFFVKIVYHMGTLLSDEVLIFWHVRTMRVYRYEMHSAPKEMRYCSTPRRLKQFVGAPFVRESIHVEVPSLNSGVLSTRLSEYIYP
jgi:hypothetical protein